jgi:nitrite reductase/ring-hydroxylating ferredoxin subunit
MEVELKLSDMQKFIVCSAMELQPGQNKLVSVDGVNIALFNVNNKIHGFRNECPHMGAPLVFGKVTGTMVPSEPHAYEYGCDNEIVRCPWHGWEFQMESGQSLYDCKKGLRLQKFDVRKEEGSIVLYKRRRKSL